MFKLLWISLMVSFILLIFVLISLSLNSALIDLALSCNEINAFNAVVASVMTSLACSNWLATESQELSLTSSKENSSFSTTTPSFLELLYADSSADSSSDSASAAA